MGRRDRNETPNSSKLRDARVADIASEQRGLITTAELHEAGLGDGDIVYRVRAGRLHPLFRGVYRVGHRAIDRDAWFLGATLSVGPDSGLGFQTACQHYEVWDGQVGEVHVVAPRRFRPQPRLQPHSVLTPLDFREVRGVRVVQPALAVVQFAAVTRDPVAVRRVAREAQVAKLVTHDELLAACSAGGRGVKRLRAALTGGPSATANGGEDVALDLIRSCGLDPLVQAPLLGFVADFYLPEHRLVIEFDGRVHDIPVVRLQDDRRQAILEAAGLRVIRLRWVDVTTLREQTRARLLAATATKLGTIPSYVTLASSAMAATRRSASDSSL